MKALAAASILVASLLGAVEAQATAGMTLKAGTLGFGADLTMGLNEKVNARLGLNSFRYGTDIDVDEDEDGGGGGTITAKLKLPWAGFWTGIRGPGVFVFPPAST